MQEETTKNIDSSKKNKNIFTNFHFWMVVLLFAICIALHYPQQILLISSPSVFSFLGLTRHAIERVLLLLPIGYAGFFLGANAGYLSLVIAAAIMLPRVFLLSDYFPDALFETISVLLVGLVINLWFNGYRKDRSKQAQLYSNLETSHRELQSNLQSLEKSHRQFIALNQISSAISQSLELKERLDRTISSVIGVMQVDAAWIYLLNKEGSALELSADRGLSEEFSKIKVGYGISGKVASTGQPLLIEDSTKETDLPESVKQQMSSILVVPLRSKGKVVGTLGVNTKDQRHFVQSEIELLTVIGNQIGIAVEASLLYQRQLEIAEKLRISEQRYRQLFESAQDAIWVHDLNGNFTAVNKASESLTGFSSNELLGMNVRRFLAGEHLGLAGQIKRKLLAGEPIEQPYDQRLIKRDGTEGIMRVASNLLLEDGKPVGFIHVARDVTKEKEMQDKLASAYKELTISHQQLLESQHQLIRAEKLTSLGQLAASVAHEVNNPLTGVLVYTELLEKKINNNDISDETVLNYLGKMKFELVRSTKLIRNLLDFSRQSPPEFKQTSLNIVVDRALDLAAHSAELQHIEVIKELDPLLPELRADADQLQQVFTNLIMNAVQAMPKGGKLTLRTGMDGNQLKLEVQDTGVGISPENMSKLFTPFFTTKAEIKGVGLGLAVAYGIIKRHKGNIEVQSKEGEGTIFTIHLLLNPESAEEKP